MRAATLPALDTAQAVQQPVLVAMSGGVDSSVAAALLRERGIPVLGVFMRNGVSHSHEPAAPSGCATAPVKANKQGCCSVADADDARMVAAALDVPFYVLDFSEEFSRIIEYFIDEYRHGRTPNPCVVCNNDLKFGKLTAYASDVGATAVATGHYAQSRFERGRWRLFRGADRAKDQSYYLFGLSQDQLARCQFPLGGMTKAEVRREAARLGLATRDKPESMEICFVPGNDYRALLRERAPEALIPGDIVRSDGTRIGSHEGAAAFTVGQRKGLGIGGGEPLFVTKIDAVTNTVVAGPKQELECGEFVASKPNWIGVPGLPAGDRLDAQVQVRYRHSPVAATLIGLVDGSVAVELAQPESAVTPGQACVFYDGEECLGGGWIER